MHAAGLGGGPVTDKASSGRVLGLVAFIVFLDMAGVGIIIPVLPGLVSQLGHTDVDGAAVIGGMMLFSYALMQFLFAPVIGGLSDRFGRRPVLLLTLTALGVDYAIMAWAPTLVWLFVGRLISGIMGATWAAANSCIADLFPPEERGAKFGLLGGAGASGFVLGPALGGVLGEMDLRLPFIAASLFALVGAAIGYAQFAETLSEDNRRRFTLSRANPLGTILRMAGNPIVIGLLSVIFLTQLASQSQISIWSFFLIEKFNWSPLQIGLSVALFGIMLVFVQGYLTGKVLPRLGPTRTVLCGLACGIPSFLLLAFAGSGAMVYSAIVVGSFSGMAFPAMQGLMSDRVEEDAQGELQGAVASTISLTSIIGPIVMSRVFAHFSDNTGFYQPGAPFVLAAALTLSGISLFLVVTRRLAR